MFDLHILSGMRTGTVVPLVPGTHIVGRSPDCPIELPDPGVSRHHAQFIVEETTLRVVDLNSANGSFVNDDALPAQEAHPLRDGDILCFGNTRVKIQHTKPSDGQVSIDPALSFIVDDADTVFDPGLSIALMDVAGQDVTRIRTTASPHEKRLEAVCWVSEALTSYRRLEDLYDPIIETLFTVFPHASRGVLLVGEGLHTLTADDVDGLEIVAQRQRGGPSVDRPKIISRTLCREVLARKTAFVYQEGDDGLAPGLSMLAMNIRSAMIVPLLVQETTLGILSIDTSDITQAFTRDDLELAATVGRQIAIALKNARLVQQAEEEAENRRNLMRFLPKPVVDQWMDGHIELALGGSICQGTIFFSDLIGFTRMSEGLTPEEVVALMNAYFDRMVPWVERTGGAIDKFMGDAIMAFWGIPFAQDDAAARAVQAGLAMQNTLVGFNRAQAQQGQAELSLGIGINSGTMVAGNVGSVDRLEYTVLGDCVNTAQRIEAQASRGQVLVSAATWAQVASIATGIRLPPVRVKNKAEPVEVYSVRGIALPDGARRLHLPACSQNGTPYWIVQRRSAGDFLLLGPAQHTPDGQRLTSTLIEWPDQTLGTIAVQETLPAQPEDGVVRYVVTLSDATLGGLLDEAPRVSPRSWDEMRR